jgi:hypothetical protein
MWTDINILKAHLSLPITVGLGIHPLRKCFFTVKDIMMQANCPYWRSEVGSNGSFPVKSH